VHDLARDRARHRRRLLRTCAGLLALSGVASALAVWWGVDPRMVTWAPYLLAPLAAGGAWWLDLRGRQLVAVALLASVTVVLTGQSGVRDPTSVGSALYLIPTALFAASFVDTARPRRRILALMLVAALLQRVLRGLAGVDASTQAFVEGTFHNVVVCALFALVLEVLHRDLATDRQALSRAYERVAQARTEAEEQAGAAVQGSQAATRFLETMSHELRTPLNAVVGYAELLIDDEPDDPQVVVDLERICDAGHHMVGLVDEVLDVSKVASGRLQRDLTLVDVGEVVHQTTELARPLLRRGVRLDVVLDDDLAPVVSDARKLRQILLNLLSNAAKHTQRGTVRVEVRQHLREVAISVSDTGVGMDPARAEEMFAAFAQVDHRQGSGLGLALCSRFARLLEGTIEVDTAVGIGSRFTLRHPVHLRHTPRDDRGDSEVSSPDMAAMVALLPARERGARWLDVGAALGMAFGLLAGTLVWLGVLPSHLGVAPYVGFVGASAVAALLNRRGQVRYGLSVLLMAAMLVELHSFVFHATASAATGYLCAIALYSTVVLPMRHMGPIYGAGAVVGVVMLALRWQQGHDAPDAFASIVIDTVIVYVGSACLLSMWLIRHRQEQASLVSATFDLDVLRAQARSLAREARAEAEAKTRFLTGMSHELRSPLHAILGYAELLLEETPSDDEARDDIERILLAGRRLLGLVNEVLDLARVRAGRMPVTPRLLGLQQLVLPQGMQRRGDGVAVADPLLLERALELLGARGVRQVDLADGALTARLVGLDASKGLVEPLAFDPYVDRPGAGWALLDGLCSLMGGRLRLQHSELALVVCIDLPTPRSAL
jgi:signal transduction histidine kinase